MADKNLKDSEFAVRFFLNVRPTRVFVKAGTPETSPRRVSFHTKNT